MLVARLLYGSGYLVQRLLGFWWLVGVCVLVFWVSFGNLLAFSLFVVLQFVMVCVWCFGLLILLGLGYCYAGGRQRCLGGWAWWVICFALLIGFDLVLVCGLGLLYDGLFRVCGIWWIVI